MIPVVTPEEMRAIDAAADVPVEELIRRAGAAVARAAIAMMGGSYGRVVAVMVGTGNNGADGRDAAERLRRRGVTVRVHDVADLPSHVHGADLVVDAAFGTGFHADPARPWQPPEIGGTPVLAVDISSGVDGLTGDAVDGALRARRTVTFQALKPGHLFGDGPELSGDVEVADIGLDTSHIHCHVVERADAAAWWPTREMSAHKWHGAVKVVAGSEAMPGAAELCTAAAIRSGSGLVSLSAPGCRPSTRSEVVQRPIGTADFAADALVDIGRFGALVIGPGLGRDDATLLAARRCIADASVPVVVDGDALFASAWDAAGAGPLLRARELPTVLTPHDGEFAVLTGNPPSSDRITSARTAAANFASTVLMKGPTTLIAAPPSRRDDADGEARAAIDELTWATEEATDVYVITHGDQRLATAGTGDVLAGLIGAALAADVEPSRAAASAAWLHAECARLATPEGVVAGDLVDLLPEAIASMRSAAPTGRGQ